jgi:tetratricopeptide (TPR) repeat protein
MQNGFDFNIFETLINARLSFLNNHAGESKKSLEDAQIKIEQQFNKFPISLAAESLKLMLDLGDYEEAIKVKKAVEDQIGELDKNIEHAITSAFEKVKSQQNEYITYNKQGVSSYNQGKYHDAYESFTEAKALSPMNIGVTINLLQSIVKLLEMNQDLDTELQKECREHYSYITNMPLKKIHQQKFENMKIDAENLMSS